MKRREYIREFCDLLLAYTDLVVGDAQMFHDKLSEEQTAVRSIDNSVVTCNKKGLFTVYDNGEKVDNLTFEQASKVLYENILKNMYSDY